MAIDERGRQWTLRQCEGCEYPLADHMAAYEHGELLVEWFICEYHTDSGLPFIEEYWDYDD